MYEKDVRDNMIWSFYFLVVESHPDSAHEDLRLDRPFPGFSAYCDSLHLESMSKKVPTVRGTFSYLKRN